MPLLDRQYIFRLSFMHRFHQNQFSLTRDSSSAGPEQHHSGMASSAQLHSLISYEQTATVTASPPFSSHCFPVVRLGVLGKEGLGVSECLFINGLLFQQILRIFFLISYLSTDKSTDSKSFSFLCVCSEDLST